LRYICHLFFASFPIFSSLNGSHILVFFSNLLTCRNPCCKTFLHVFAVLLPSGKQTVCYWKWPSRNIGFTHEKLWFSIVMLNYQRVERKLLSLSDPHPDTRFWHSVWHTIWKNIFQIYSGVQSDILSGIYF
jgi:hypothetical protein